ncbi:MAG: AAA family ATPase [Oscillospiraceae bacterium]|nr:AAA family ATPase [Oscillospiraceae bacterium]
MILVILSAACGVGKTTVKNHLKEGRISEFFACIDTDEVGLNWWDYAGTDKESKYSEDCLKAAVRLAEGKNLLFFSCLNPDTFYGEFDIPAEITAAYFIAMTCSDDEISARLKARPPERLCGSDEFIRKQIEYNNWFIKNKGKFQLYIDNTDMSVQCTAEKIEDFIEGFI